MASDQGDEQRLAAFVAALGGNENSNPTTNGHATGHNTWAASADDAWKEPPSPSAEPEGDYPESLRLQEQFLDTHGYK